MTSLHPGELKLRRFRAGELLGTEANELNGHLEGCGRCRARLKSLEQEEEQFQREISFDRFAAGVQRALKTASHPRPLRWATPAMAMAAGLLVAVVVAPLLRKPSTEVGSRIKGGASVVLRIGENSGSAQRGASAQGAEALAPGERVRIGYQSGSHRYLLAVSIDQRGMVTELYAEGGRSLEVRPGDEARYLPESLEFIGDGLERVIVVLSDQALDAAQVKRAAEKAYDAARGDLRQLQKLDVPGEQFHRLLLKP